MGNGNPPPVAVADDSKDNDLARFKISAFLIVTAIVAALVTLLIAINAAQGKASSDVVAMVGAITTFLGTAIGLVFGVHAGQTGVAQAATTAKLASNLATQAKAVSDSAVASMQRTGDLYSESNSQNAHLLNQVQTLDSLNRRYRSGVRQLHALSAPEHKQRADRILNSLAPALAPNDVRDNVQDSVQGWIANITGKPADSIDPSLKFEAAPPDGYGLVPGAYQQMCDDCTQDINQRCQSSIVMSGPWRNDHEAGAIASFINDATTLVIANG